MKHLVFLLRTLSWTLMLPGIILTFPGWLVWLLATTLEVISKNPKKK